MYRAFFFNCHPRRALPKGQVATQYQSFDHLGPFVLAGQVITTPTHRGHGVGRGSNKGLRWLLASTGMNLKKTLAPVLHSFCSLCIFIFIAFSGSIPLPGNIKTEMQQHMSAENRNVICLSLSLSLTTHTYICRCILTCSSVFLQCWK